MENASTRAYETILTESKDGILTITFNRPKQRNAMSSLMMQEFSSELERWENDPTERVCIIFPQARRIGACSACPSTSLRSR